MVTTLLACLPSEPFRHGFFEFYTLSTFHLYIAIVVGVFSILLSQLAFSRRNLGLVCALAIVAMLPLGGMLYLAGAFVTGSLDTIAKISEAKSPYSLFIERGESDSTMYMSWLLLFMFPMMLVNLWWAWRRRDPLLQFVAVMSVFGLAFFQFQYRFNVFGLVPMLLTPLLVAKELVVGGPSRARAHRVRDHRGVVRARVPPDRGAWQTTWALASHLSYSQHPAAPGRAFSSFAMNGRVSVLADVEAGHWVRYHTSCSVIANVFLLTPQHAAKLAENESLMLLPPAQLLKQRHDLRYVLVFHAVDHSRQSRWRGSAGAGHAATADVAARTRAARAGRGHSPAVREAVGGTIAAGADLLAPVRNRARLRVSATMSPWFRYTLLWIAGSAALVFASLGLIQAAYVDGHFIPSNPDAFYHARRILDAVMQDTSVIQFDPRIHAPEGSWLTWPWGFDQLLATITGGFGPYPNEYAASKVLMNIPVAAAPIAVGLLLVLTRQLRLSGLQSAIAVVAFALLPAMFTLFAVGNVDHHFAEMLWLLMTVCASIWFFESRASLAPALVLAAVLGTAVAMQNGLFILQLIVLIPFGWRWLRGEELPEKRPVLVFAVRWSRSHC